jgi:hypothetical protein
MGAKKVVIIYLIALTASAMRGDLAASGTVKFVSGTESG